MRINIVRNILKRIYYVVRNLYQTIQNIHQTIQYCCMNKNNILVINAWIKLYKKEPEHINLGDELNYYLIKELSGKQIVNKFNLFIPKLHNICCIGSIIDSMADSKSIIWGSGAISDKKKLKCIPLKICAVRGKLTRQYLIDQGIKCPEVYGDPALLLPKIYVPNVNKRYSIGIVPHFVDMNNEYIEFLFNQMPESVKIIHMSGYNDWHDVIDEINECHFILSSSLHGLIIADAYGIPNKWIEFSQAVIGNGFKFRDYFSSVGREDNKPIQISKSTSLIDLLNDKGNWKPIDIDLNKLLNACPFKIQEKFLNS